MEKFEYKSFFEQKKMNQEELNQYYKALRKYECETNAPIKGIQLRKKIYCLVKFALKMDKIFSGRTVKILSDKREKNNKPKIYACTHIGRYDIESAIEAIGEATWFIMGDPGETYTNFNGILLRLHGVSWFAMGDTEECKYDAHTVNVRQKKILTLGGNELSFPEAAWNIDPVLPVGEIHPGVVKRAIATGAEIVPVAIEQYRGKYLKHYYVNIGKNIDLSNTTLDDVPQLTEELRSTMAALKWDIWEQKGRRDRKNLPIDYQDGYEEFINSIMCDSENGYTIEEINRTIYKPKDKEKVVTAEEAFAHLYDLNINKNNAFLLRGLEKKIENPKVLKKTK